ncbi:hypothetical protein [Microcella humidisoli]|uniref:Lipoprotein n=1 Tax=Microcella humidisoli TaxID=2963406 RepID=A0ABY5FV83_9MICO|nr:hypothetical protein [Microcella humidisoli]UTT62032.1 hypothetical protein NNL39_10185 [Microcella humidisoli]
MRDRDAARPGRVAVALALAVTAAALLAACSTAPSPTAPALAQTLADRDAAAAAAHAQTLERSAVFLREKWGPVALPEEAIERWVAASSWGPTMARCLSEEGFPGAQPADGGERIDFSGVRVSGPRELFEIDVAVYRCQSLYPVRAWFDDEVRDIEAPWALDYTRAVVVPCLLASGHEVPPVPTGEGFRAGWRTEAAYDPFALVGEGPGARTRAEALCPAAETVLDGAP